MFDRIEIKHKIALLIFIGLAATWPLLRPTEVPRSFDCTNAAVQRYESTKILDATLICQATDLEKNGKFQEAQSALLGAARLNTKFSGVAKYLLHLSFRKGWNDGVVDDVSAKYWLKQAAESGDSLAVSRLYYMGIHGLPRDTGVLISLCFLLAGLYKAQKASRDGCCENIWKFGFPLALTFIYLVCLEGGFYLSGYGPFIIFSVYGGVIGNYLNSIKAPLIRYRRRKLREGAESQDSPLVTTVVP